MTDLTADQDRAEANLKMVGLLINDDEFIPQFIVDAYYPFAVPNGLRVRAVFEIAKSEMIGE